MLSVDLKNAIDNAEAIKEAGTMTVAQWFHFVCGLREIEERVSYLERMVVVNTEALETSKPENVVLLSDWAEGSQKGSPQ